MKTSATSLEQRVNTDTDIEQAKAPDLNSLPISPEVAALIAQQVPAIAATAPTTGRVLAASPVPGIYPIIEAVRVEVNKLTTTAARIRYLHSVGLNTTQISKTLDILYQHVRNTLTRPVKRPLGLNAPPQLLPAQAPVVQIPQASETSEQSTATATELSFTSAKAA
jgi:hypothetical protein